MKYRKNQTLSKKSPWHSPGTVSSFFSFFSLTLKQPSSTPSPVSPVTHLHSQLFSPITSIRNICRMVGTAPIPLLPRHLLRTIAPAARDGSRTRRFPRHPCSSSSSSGTGRGARGTIRLCMAFSKPLTNNYVYRCKLTRL